MKVFIFLFLIVSLFGLFFYITTNDKDNFSATQIVDGHSIISSAEGTSASIDSHDAKMDKPLAEKNVKNNFKEYPISQENFPVGISSLMEVPEIKKFFSSPSIQLAVLLKKNRDRLKYLDRKYQISERLKKNEDILNDENQGNGDDPLNLLTKIYLAVQETGNLEYIGHLSEMMPLGIKALVEPNTYDQDLKMAKKPCHQMRAIALEQKNDEVSLCISSAIEDLRNNFEESIEPNGNNSLDYEDLNYFVSFLIDKCHLTYETAIYSYKYYFCMDLVNELAVKNIDHNGQKENERAAP